MKKLVKVLTLVLTLTLVMALPTEAQAKTTTIRVNATNDTFFAAKSSKKTVTKVGNYNVKVSKKAKYANAQAGSFIDFKAPKAGVYQIKMSNLHSAKDKEGYQTSMDVCMWTVDKGYCDADRTYYFAGLKDYNTITLDAEWLYNYQKKTGNSRKDIVKQTTINCKLKKGDHLVISLGNFWGIDYTATVDTFAFDMKITKK